MVNLSEVNGNSHLLSGIGRVVLQSTSKNMHKSTWLVVEIEQGKQNIPILISEIFYQVFSFMNKRFL